MRIKSGDARLDQFVLDIEFLLISVVQGIALSALAVAAIAPITQLQWQYWPYIVSAFLVSFIFWSQAIVHALSFIDWPLDLSHNFFYFLSSLIQVILFSQVTNPQAWFIGMSVLFAVAFLLYIVDYRIIKSRRSDYQDVTEDKALYAHLKKQHELDMWITVPLGLLFNVSAAFLIFHATISHFYLILIQVLFELVVLGVTIHTFRKRSKLIYNRAVKASNS